MNFVFKKWLQSRWIEMPALPAGELLRSSTQLKYGLVYGMRLAVLDDQAAALLADNRLISVFLPGAYQLEEDKIPALTPHPKHDWLFLAEICFLNMAPFADQLWQPLAPVLTRDRDLGLLQLELEGTYTARIDNPTLFLQHIVVEKGLREWPPIHQWLQSRLSELVIHYAARNPVQLRNLDRFQARALPSMLSDLNHELEGKGLSVNDIQFTKLNLHPQMQQLLQRPGQTGQKEADDYNQAMMRTILEVDHA